jgi:hypothetical protein
MIYIHVLNQGPSAVRSPLDRLIAGGTASVAGDAEQLSQPRVRPVRAYLASPRKPTRREPGQKG